MPRKRKNKVYFTLDTEKAIIQYNSTKDPVVRNKIYKDEIQYPFEKILA
jgi:hypothetical protein